MATKKPAKEKKELPPPVAVVPGDGENPKEGQYAAIVDCTNCGEGEEERVMFFELGVPVSRHLCPKCRCAALGT